MNLSEAVKALGSTAEEVTLKLREMGIRGYRLQAGSCPIAKYLNACGLADVAVASYIYVFSRGGGEESVMTPSHVSRWISDFDGGKYPEFYPFNETTNQQQG